MLTGLVKPLFFVCESDTQFWITQLHRNERVMEQESGLYVNGCRHDNTDAMYLARHRGRSPVAFGARAFDRSLTHVTDPGNAKHMIVVCMWGGSAIFSACVFVCSQNRKHVRQNRLY